MPLLSHDNDLHLSFFNLSKTGNFSYKVTYMNYKYENTSVTSIPSTALPAGANYQFSIVRW